MSAEPVACAAEIVTSSVVAGAVQINMCVAAGICPLCGASGHAAAVKPAAGSAGAISPADAWIQLLAVPEYAGTSISYVPPASNDVTAAPSCVTIITTYTHSCVLRGFLWPPHRGRHVQHIASILPAHRRRHVQHTCTEDVAGGRQNEAVETHSGIFFRCTMACKASRWNFASHSTLVIERRMPCHLQAHKGASVATMNLKRSYYCARARCSAHIDPFCFAPCHGQCISSSCHSKRKHFTQCTSTLCVDYTPTLWKVTWASRCEYLFAVILSAGVGTVSWCILLCGRGS